MKLPIINSKNEGVSKQPRFFTSIGNSIGALGKSVSSMMLYNKQQSGYKDAKDSNKTAHQYAVSQNKDLTQYKMLSVLEAIEANTKLTNEKLDNLELNGDKSQNSFDFKSLLPFLLPALGGIVASLAPEMMKEITTALKYAKLLPDAAKAGKGFFTALKAGDSILDIAKGGMSAAKLLQPSADADANGKRRPSKMGGFLSAGMIAGRLAEGDYTGAALETASLATSFIGGKFGKIAKIAGLALDTSIVARDFSKRADEKVEEQSSNTEETKVEEKSSVLPALGGAGAMLGVGAYIKKMVDSVPSIPSAATNAAGDVATGAGKGLLKTGAKLIPGVGLALSGGFAVNRMMDGDYIGALGEVTSGLVGLIPGFGTAGAIAIQAGLAVRDASRESTDTIKQTSNETSENIKKSSSELTNNATTTSNNLLENSNKLNELQTTVSDNTQSMFGIVTATISTNVKAAVTGLKNFALTVSDAAKRAISNTLSFIQNAASGLMNMIKGSATGQFVGNAIDGVKSFFGFGNDKTTSNAPSGSTIGISGSNSVSNLGGVSKPLPQSNKYDGLASDEWKKNNVDPSLFPLLKAQIAAESGFDPNARSGAGAFGLTQFMPATARQYGVKAGDSEDAVRSQLAGQAKYMNYLIKRFKGDFGLALMGYNWGEGNVDKWIKNGRNPNDVPKETKDYVAKITGNKSLFDKDFGSVKSNVSMGTMMSAASPTTAQAATSSGVPPLLARQQQPVETGGGSGGGGSTGSIPTTTAQAATSSKVEVKDTQAKPDEKATPKGASLGEAHYMELGKKAVKLKDRTVDMGNLNSGFRDKFYTMVGEFYSKTNRGIVVTEGFRTRERQMELKRTYPDTAAQPGLSMHEYGLAIDANRTELNEMDKMGLMKKYGFVRPYSNEPWHIEHSAIRDNRAKFRSNDPSIAAQATSLITGQPVGEATPNSLNTSMSDSTVGGEDGTQANGVIDSIDMALRSLVSPDVIDAARDFIKGGKVDAPIKPRYTSSNTIPKNESEGEYSKGFNLPDSRNGIMEGESEYLKPFVGDVIKPISPTLTKDEILNSTGFKVEQNQQVIQDKTNKKSKFDIIRSIFPNIGKAKDEIMSGNLFGAIDTVKSGGLFTVNDSMRGNINKILENTIPSYNPTNIESITPDYDKIEDEYKLDDRMGKLHDDMMMKQNSVSVNIPPTTISDTSSPKLPSQGSSNGVDIPLSVRNNDSIIKMVAMEYMKHSM